jgi:hypothetical protein
MAFTQLAGLYSPLGKSQSGNELGWANFRLDQIVSSLALLAGLVRSALALAATYATTLRWHNYTHAVGAREHLRPDVALR